MGEGRAARKAVGAVRYAAVRYRNAAKTARKRGGVVLMPPAPGIPRLRSSPRS